MDRDELLERSHPAKTEHGTFPSSKLQMGILRAIVEPATGLAIVGQYQVLQRRTVGPELVRDENMRVAMPPLGFPEEFQGGFSIPTPGTPC